MSPCAALQAHTYEVHARLGHLCSNEVPARLQLAALYAATGSLLPEPVSQLTGAQQAMQLVRQCWGTRPLGPAGPQQLADIARLGGHMAAGLRLLSFELLASASQLNDLHFPDGAPEHAEPPVADPDWGPAYLQECRLSQAGGSGGNPRLLLTPGEERRAMGVLRPSAAAPLWQRLRLYDEIQVPPCPVAADVVPAMEARLLQLVAAAAAVPGSPPAPSTPDSQLPPYPLRVGSGEGAHIPLERRMHAELEDSWRVHHRTAVATVVVPGMQQALLRAQASARGVKAC